MQSSDFAITVVIDSWPYCDRPYIYEGDVLSISVEPGGRGSVALLSGQSVVGYVPRDVAWLALKALDEGLRVSATVLSAPAEGCPTVRIASCDPYGAHSVSGVAAACVGTEQDIDRPVVSKGAAVAVAAAVCVVITAISVVSYIGKHGTSAPVATESPTAMQTAPAAASSKPSAASAQPKAAQTASMTASQSNALKSAKSYLQYGAFSYSGLIGQLEYEGYSTEDATWAADNCGAGWQSQALKSAKSYLAYSSFSRSGLIGQLEYEGFSAEDAVYAADNCGADWYAQAVGSAQSYLAYGSFSHSGLVEQLEYEGYTHEEAEYGVSAAGL